MQVYLTLINKYISFFTLNPLRYTIEHFFQYLLFFRRRRDPISFQLYQRDFHEK